MFPVLLAILGSAPAAADGDFYLRGGLGWAWSGDATFSDVNCTQSQPPALFGCQNGTDGRPIGARGDFGGSALLLAGIGRRLTPWLRAELSLGYRPGLQFQGGANFLGVSGPQPVRGDVASTSLLAAGFVDLPALGRLRPYLGAGLGMARNHIGAITYSFPSLGDTAITRVVGGDETGFAWFAAAGVTIGISDRLLLDLAYRYTDLGDIRADAGRATIIRRNISRELLISGTETELNTQELIVSLRYCI